MDPFIGPNRLRDGHRSKSIRQYKSRLNCRSILGGEPHSTVRPSEEEYVFVNLRRRLSARPLRPAFNGTFCKTGQDIRREHRITAVAGQVQDAVGGSRREEALIDFGFRISDFGFGSQSLVTSAATPFIRLNQLNDNGGIRSLAG